MNILNHNFFKVNFFILICHFGFGQFNLSNVANRKCTSLNGKWNYIIDPYETGFYNYRGQAYDEVDASSSSAFFNNSHLSNKDKLIEYDFDLSPCLIVPGDWNSQEEKLLYYEGTIWMKKSFDYDLQKINRLFLYFTAVNYQADVYLNGRKLGVHKGGFTPFSFEITDVVLAKDNYLIVKINNNRHKEDVPTINTDWFNYGGITGNVELVEEPNIFIEQFSLQLYKTSLDSIHGFVKINGSITNETITIEIPELGLKQDFITSEKGMVDFVMSANNILHWSPENPKLYEVFASTAYEKLRDNIGFRCINSVKNKILLNGKPIFLKGISIHGENALKGSRAYSEEDALQALTWAKELGCNYVRLAHYPHSESILRLADKMGILVWEEIPVYWTIEFTNEATLTNAKNQLTEVIARDRNKASVVILSMANETPPSKERNSFIIDLIKLARSLDSSRLISAALETHHENGISIVNDTLGNYLDIVAFNEYRGWYGGNLDNAPDAIWKVDFDKPVIISEFGGGAKEGLHGEKTERWTEEYQAYLYEQNIKMIEKIPNYCGMSPWILADFRSPRRVLPTIQDGYNRKGLISNEGKRKMVFYVLQKYYSRK